MKEYVQYNQASMQKIIVIGCPGSGKSTFAKALHSKTGLPLVHLDMLFWNADKTTVERSVFRERLQEVLQQEQWILDGNFSSTMELRFAYCDTVFFLDYPVEVCLDGVRSRIGTQRTDLPWLETEEDPEFMEYIRNFSGSHRPQISELLEKYPSKEIHIFTGREQAEAFINQL